MVKKYIDNDYFYLLIIYLTFLAFALSLFSWIVDDLYIYFRYANNFASGKGIVYNTNEFVEGFSSFSWFLILSIFSFISFDPELGSKITGLIFALLNLILLYKICMLNNLGKLSLLACFLMVLNLPFILWSISGFEIMFYIFLLLSCFYRIIKLSMSKSDLIILPGLLFLISITRPEGILFSLTFISFTYLISKNKTFTLKIFILYGILFGLFLTFRLFYFRDLLPNTYYAKLDHSLVGYYEIRTYKNGLFYILFFLKDNPQFLLLIFLIPLTFGKLNSNKIFLFTMSLVLFQLGFIIYAGGDWMVQYRFAVPAVPFLSLATVFCIREFTIIYNINKITAIVLTVFVLATAFVRLVISDYSVIKKEIVLWNNVKELSGELKSIIPENSLVANGASGIMPYYLEDVTFLDIVGLTNKHIAKNGYRHGTWFERSLPDYVFGKNPEWLIMWKRKNDEGIYKFENAAPCYYDLSLNSNFEKYHLHKIFDVYDDSRIELYKLNVKAN